MLYHFQLPLSQHFRFIDKVICLFLYFPVRHTLTGAKILSEIKSAPELIYGAKYHHERYDGKGYPCGLKGEEIPEVSAIIAVADAYDAMTSNRSYRKLLPQETVKQEIEKGLGTQFNPKWGKIMLKLIEKDKDYKMHQ